MWVQKLESSCGNATVKLGYDEIRKIAVALDTLHQTEKDSAKTETQEEEREKTRKLWLYFARLQVLCKESSLDFENEYLV